MKKITLLLSALVLFSPAIIAQSGYDIKINFKGCKDTVVYLVKYTFGTPSIADTCKKVKNGQIQFKGKKDLDKGMYVLVSEGKSTYFDFFINETQKFGMSSDISDMLGSLKSIGNKENEQFFTYVKYINSKNGEFNKTREEAKSKSKEDSAKYVSDKIKAMNEDVRKFEVDFMLKNKGTFLYDVLNLKMEKHPVDVPKASNGRPDSVYQYYYYKNHFFDGINFKDDRIIRNQFFDVRVKRYFESVIVQHPDTVIKEIDKVLSQCIENSDVYNFLLGHFTYSAEQNKIMGFDKVFVHMADKYIIPGKASGAYSEETRKKIKERADIMRGLLLETKVPDLFMIDSLYGKQVLKMGFDTVKTSKGVTDLYYKNLDKLTPMFRSLYQVKAKYTVLVFWAADCGHCQTEVPKLHENLKALKGKVDVKVYAVQTKEELFDSWKKFVAEKKLTDFINVFDPIHLNNLKESFDIYSTPVIYILDKDKKIKAKRLDADKVIELIKVLEDIEKNSAK